MIRKIVSIDEEKCNGCGLCATACHEGAIEIIDGKAKLLHDKYCDGLGDCLPACPVDAIKLIEREAHEYDDDAVQVLLAEKKAKKAQEEKPEVKAMPCGCPGTMAKKIQKEMAAKKASPVEKNAVQQDVPSELSQWPVQLKLVNVNADYFKDANLLVAADCTAYAYGNFHQEFIKDKITVIGCPKLDDNQFYAEKLAEILKNNSIKSITVVRMEVPCCAGIVQTVKKAMLASETIVPYREVTIGVNGNIIASN